MKGPKAITLWWYGVDQRQSMGDFQMWEVKHVLPERWYLILEKDLFQLDKAR